MDLEQQVFELHSKNLLDEEIAKIIKMSADTVAYYRKKRGLLNNRNKKLAEIRENVIKDLRDNKTVYSIANKYNCSDTFIRNLSKYYNIKTLDFQSMVKDRRVVNNNPFEDLNNSEVNYWLGFLAADGGIFKDRISLGLQEKDEFHIDKYIKFINSKLTKRIVIKDNKYKSFVTSFRSTLVANFLNNLGITENKSYTIDYKGVFNRDFLRGVLDGDGYIRKTHTEVSITTASLVFAKQIQEFIINNFQVNCTIRKDRNNYTVGVYGRKQVEKCLKELYENADIYLERKYQNAMLYSNI